MNHKSVTARLTAQRLVKKQNAKQETRRNRVTKGKRK
jgi:hypothetical protein